MAAWLKDFYALRNGCGEAVESERNAQWRAAMRDYAAARERLEMSLRLKQLQKTLF